MPDLDKEYRDVALAPATLHYEVMKAASRLVNSVRAHPDCEPDSEFEMYADGLAEALDAISSGFSTPNHARF